MRWSRSTSSSARCSPWRMRSAATRPRSGSAPARPRSTCSWRAPACTPGTTSVTGPWPRSKTSASVTCPGWWCTTATKTTTRSSSPGWSTNCARLTSSEILPMPPSATRTRTGRPRSPTPTRSPRTAGNNALRDLVHAANTARQANREAIDDQLLYTRLSWLRAGVAVGLSEVEGNPDPKGKQPPGRCLLEVLRDRLDDVVRFAYDLKVPPTSNQAERDVRPAKTQQKISGRLTSEAVTRSSANPGRRPHRRPPDAVGQPTPLVNNG